MLNTIAQGSIVAVGFCLKFSGKPLVQRLQVVVLLLQSCLYGLSLLACVSVLLYLLLKVGSCRLQGALLCSKCILYILAFLLQNERVIFTELVLTHNRVYLNVGNLHRCRTFRRVALFRLGLRVALVACCCRQCCKGSYCQHFENVFRIHCCYY